MANTGEFIKMFHIFFVILGFAGMVGFPMMMRAAAGASGLDTARTCLRYANIFDGLSGIGFLGAGLIGLGLAIYQEWDFAENTWLTASITLLVVALVGATIVQQPALFKLNRLAKEAPGPGVPPELNAELSKPLLRISNGILWLMLLAIFYMMVAKPGVDFSGIDNWPVNT
ncbi:MAG TPA: DUF2269 family protein [Dehalococcoidia bacterium]|nr:DUF2269 family protein [Dehalococcoidia bacterium]